MKIFISGDWQLDINPGYDKVDPDTNRSTRFQENLEILERMTDEALADGAEGMLHLGDLTEKRDPKALEMEAAANLFARFMKPGGRVWAVAGNHDGAFFDVSSSSFAPLAAMRPDQFKLFHHVAFDRELQMLAIPYIHRATPEEIQGLVEAACRQEDGIVSGPAFAAVHYGLQGCVVGPKNLVTAGDYLGPDQFRAFPLDHIFAGHIHKAQEIMIGTAHGWHPGSPVICDMGERNDRKTYLLFDTVTREVRVKEVPQRRRWISIPYSPAIAQGMPMWTGNDLVKVVGTYEKPDYPKATLEAAFKAGLPRPFALEVEVKAAKTERAMRSLSVTSAGGLREALQMYVREKYPNFSKDPGQIGPATALAMSTLQEQGGLTYCDAIQPSNITISNFMTFIRYKSDFMPGEPMLVAVENGVGKTNFFEAILWALTGKVSKGLDLAGVVRQGAQDTEVTLSLLGQKADEEDQAFRITRRVKLNKAGKAAQTLTLERWDRVREAFDKTLSDGTQAEIQGRIDSLVGGSFITLRTTAFKFQKDNSPFIACHPTERKAVIGEVTGLAPLNRAWKVLDGRRLESARALEAGKNRLAGMIAAGEGNEDRIAALKTEMEVAATGLVAAQTEIPGAEAAEAGAREVVTAAKAKAESLETQLRAQPNTEAKLMATTQAVTTFDTTYQNQRAEKLLQHAQLKTAITDAETEIAATPAPTPQEIESLEIVERMAAAARDRDRDACEKARGTLAVTDAQLQNWTTTSTTLKQGLAKVEADLTALGELMPVADAEAVQARAEAEASTADEACAAALQGAVSAREALKQLRETAAALVREREGFAGKDIGTCSKCGQAIDSTHIEQELARIGAAADANGEAIETAEAQVKAADEALLRTSAEKTKTQALAKTCADAAQALKLKLQAQAQAQASLADLQAKLAAATEQVNLKTGERNTAVTLVSTLSANLVQAEAALAQAQATLATARTQAQKVQATRGRLQAMQEQMQAVLEAGLREKAQYESEIQKLQAAALAAKTEHDGQQVLTQLLRDQVQAARAAAAEASAILTGASLALAAVRSRISTAEQRIQDFRNQIKRIKDQQQALVTARFELGVLTERAEIDEIAAGLLDARNGLPVYLIDQALPFLEDRINHYLGKLGMERLVVELSTLADDKETLAVLIDNGRPGPRLDIAAFSGGQLDRVEYGVKCALADLARQTRGVTFGLVCFDEPSGGLNAAGKEALIALLYERSEAYPVTILTSHDEALIRAFHNQIRFGQGPQEETVVMGAEIKEVAVPMMEAA